MKLHITASFLIKDGPSVLVETYPPRDLHIQVTGDTPQEIIIPQDRASDLIEAIRVACRLDD